MRTAQLAPYLPGPLKDKTLIPGSCLYIGLQKAFCMQHLKRSIRRQRRPSRCTAIRNTSGSTSLRGACYKAAPLEGVWATPPYMHNGSVPNLYEMLVPACRSAPRSSTWDESSIPSRSAWIPQENRDLPRGHSAQLPGVRTSGHSFENGPRGSGIIGPLLTDEERWAIVWYPEIHPGERGPGHAIRRSAERGHRAC